MKKRSNKIWWIILLVLILFVGATVTGLIPGLEQFKYFDIFEKKEDSDEDKDDDTKKPGGDKDDDKESGADTGIVDDEFSTTVFKYTFGEETKTARMDGFKHATTGPAKTVIPQSVTKDGVKYTVNRINQSAFYHKHEITSLTIPGSVKEIYSRAFEECENLISVVIHNGLEHIPAAMFLKCTRLTSITVPDSVTRVSDGCISDCDNLKTITCSMAVEELFRSIAGFSNNHGDVTFVRP